MYPSPATRGGATVMHALRADDRLQLTQPLGITAMLGMADRLREVGADYRLAYAGRSRPLMAYLDDIVQAMTAGSTSTSATRGVAVRQRVRRRP